jgi:hypothetical protein
VVQGNMRLLRKCVLRARRLLYERLQMYGSECERLNVKRRPHLHRMKTFLHASPDQLSHPIQDEQCAL